jgi:hypothetical protein
MTDSTLEHVTFDEWAIDVTFAKYSGAIAFVPICGDEVVWGLTMIQDRAPGPLVGVVSQDGMADVDQWVADNPDWMLRYTKAEELCDG